MTMEFDRSIKSVLNILSDTKWHDLYELHEKYNLSPIEIIEIVEQLLEIGLICQDGYLIKINTDKDKKIDIDLYKSLRNRFFEFNNDNYESFKIRRLAVNEFYLPNLEKCDIQGLENKCP